jgi:type IV pilus assembly protein PilZ
MLAREPPSKIGGLRMSESSLVRPVQGQKRAHERYEVTIPVDCSTQQIFLSNHVCNISRGGLFIRSDHPLPLQAEVSLVLELPDGVRIRATGRVIWNYDVVKGSSQIIPGSGIRFVEMSPQDRTVLEAYLKRLAQRRPS